MDRLPRLTGLVVLATCAMPIVLGIITHSLRVGLALGAAAFLLIVARAYAERHKWAVFWWTGLIALFSIGAIMSLSGMPARWWWIFPYAVAGLVFFLCGLEAKNAGESWSALLIAGGVTIIVLGVVYAAFLHQHVPADLGRARRNYGQLVHFLNQVFTTWWGIPNVLLALAVLWGWARRSAWLMWFAVLAAILVISSSSRVADAATRVVGVSPATWMEWIITASADAWGTAGWGILLASVAIPVAVLPHLRLAARAQRVAATATLGGTAQDTDALENALQRNDMSLGAAVFAGLVTAVVYVGVAVSLWVALRRFAGESTDLSFWPLRIDDLTVPSFIPVLEWPYFTLAAAVALAAVLQRFVALRMGGWAPVLWVCFAAPLVGALFVPAGVMLLGLGETLTATSLMPVIYGRRPRTAVMPTRTPIDLSDAIERSLRYAEPLEEEVEEGGGGFTPVSAPLPSLAGVELFTCDGRLVDLAISPDDTFFLIEESGHASAWRGGRERGSRSLNVSRPLGIAPAGQEGVVFADGGGRIAQLVLQNDELEMPRTTPTEPLTCYAVNAFGTGVAIGDGARRGVRLVVLARETVQDLSPDIPSPTALAFSGDGRTLAIGCADGSLYLHDVAAASPGDPLRADDLPAGPVTALLACADGHWLAVHDSNHAVRWNPSGRPEAQAKLPCSPTCVAVDQQTGALAFGSRQGFIRVCDRDLRATLLDEKVHDGPVVSIVFRDEGASVVSAGRGGDVRKTRID